jgi:hypothetical protein
MAHLQALAADKSREREVKMAKEVLNQMREAIENIGKQLQAQAQKEAMARARANQPQFDPKARIAMEKANVDNQIKLRQAEIDNRIKVTDAQQKLALRDAETAQKIRKNKLA